MKKEELSKYVGTKIKYFRKSKKLTQEDLGNLMGTKKATISNWENGYRSPQQDSLFELADILEVSINDFFPPVSNVIEIKKTQNIPVVGTIACGDPILAQENISDTIPFPVELLPSGNLFFLKAQGNSMEPTIKEDALVLIRKQEEVENGEIAAVLVNGDTEATLKKVRKLGDTILLEAINEEYAPYLVNKENPARIIGKAIKVLNEL